ncbi:MAG TPA: histidinol-phosphatase HisJ family protein [Candidatus Borkfalkia excrementipullorum]|nr:histidinol-phosphatase HisJ family protein [Candidatus Borkfalkia excrementipullorum]
MIRTDIHTHTKFSADGRNSIEEMIAAAMQKGLAWYGISEHFNYDYDRLHLTIDGQEVPPIDERAYFTRARELQKQLRGKLHLLVGAEFGYDNANSTLQRYIETEQEYSPDFVVNSVHTCLGMDCYFPHYCVGKSKEYAYNAYLYRVLESLDAPYRYDIVAHVGYCSRNATYPDPKLRYEDYADVLDEILKRIIARGKILEVNSSAKTAGSPFIPDTDILERYFELGGRMVSFASDAHDTTRIADRRDIVVAALKKIGFTHLTIPDKGRYLQLEI